VTSFKRRLAERDHQTGLWLSLGSSSVAEVCATAGFDWLLVDGEHAPNDLRGVLEQLRAIEPHTAAVVRPLSSDAAHVKPLLDLGVRNFLLPMINSKDQARELLRTMKYPPVGTRGMASALTRASTYGRMPDYIRTADENLCLVAQIETPQAVEAAEGIASVDGIDALFVGLYDLSATMGYVDMPAHPAVRDALRSVTAAAHRVGKAVGTLAPTPELAQIAVLAGCKLVAYGSDVGLLAAATADLLTRRSLSRPVITS
jgi:4-hydroxy-2-oxoheptanedioate aldolase